VAAIVVATSALSAGWLFGWHKGGSVVVALFGAGLLALVGWGVSD
jgi:hypothetical protein